jgi:hypothetical protein
VRIGPGRCVMDLFEIPGRVVAAPDGKPTPAGGLGVVDPAEPTDGIVTQPEVERLTAPPPTVQSWASAWPWEL